MRRRNKRWTVFGGVGGAIALLAPLGAARADDTASLRSIENQIAQLRRELAGLHAAEVARGRAARAAALEAAEARREAARANAALAAAGGGKSFSGASVNGGGPFLPGYIPPTQVGVNDIGRHPVETAGRQATSGLGEYGRFQLGALTVQLGGYIEADAFARTRNLSAGPDTAFNSIPYGYSPTYHEPEFRGSAQQSRASILVQGDAGDGVRVAGYGEADFGSAGTTSNSNESNSYTLRLRQAYATVDDQPIGFHFLGGQAYSLVTLNRIGITPRQEQLPLTVDNQYVPGFVWARQWQARFVESFDHHRLWAGLSLEEPQATFSVPSSTATGVIGGTPNYDNTGGSLLNSTANYSDDIAPDVIAKVAADPSYGHYELFGLARFIHDDVVYPAPVTNADRTALAGGVGAGAVLPILGPKLFATASTLVGQGIGRYGTSQLPDATLNQNGTPIPIPEVDVLLGLVAHPIKTVDLYAYAGTEQEARRSFDDDGKPYGYGNPQYSDAGCDTEGDAATTCSGNTRGIAGGATGFYWRFLHGGWGTLQLGLQYSYDRRTAFDGTGATRVSVVTPKTDENVVYFDFRYLPFL